MEFSTFSERQQKSDEKSVQTSSTECYNDEKKEEEDVTTANQDGDRYIEFMTKRSAIKDSKYAWMKCFAAFTIQIVIVGVLHAFGVFFVAFIEEFNTTKAAAAWAGSLAYGVTMFLGPMATSVILRIGVRGSIVVGSLLCAVAMLISSAMTSMTWLYLSFSLLYGMGCCLAYSPTMTIAEDYFSKYLSVATGITVSGSSIGTLILNPTSQALVSSIGWRATFRVLAGFCVIGAICGLAFEGRPPTAMPAEIVQKSPLRRLVADLHLWKNKVYLVYVLGLFLVMFGYYIPYVHLVSHAMQLGIPASQGSIIIMILGASTAIGRILFGKIITFGILDRLHMQQLSMIVTGMACMLLPLIKTFGGFVVYVVCVGLVDGCFVVMMPLITVTLAGVDNKIIAWGYLVCFTSVTFTLGPPVAGWIYDATGSYDLAFHIAGIPILLGAAVMFFIPWAQRTAYRMNDALSTAGDIDYVTASQSMYSDAQSMADNMSRVSQTSSVMSMWAAPAQTVPSRRGSVRGSFRGSVLSVDSRGPLDMIKERGFWKRATPGVDVHDINVSVPSPESSQGREHSFETSKNQMMSSKGRRARSLSESSNGREQRGVQWVDLVDYKQKPLPNMGSDPTAGEASHPPSSLRRNQITKSDQDMFQNVAMCEAKVVEVRDDLMGIFMETFLGRQQQFPVYTPSTNSSIVTQVSQNGSYSSSPTPSAQGSREGTDGNQRSRCTSPIAIDNSQRRSPSPQIPSPKMWNSPLGSPPSSQLQFMQSPPPNSNSNETNQVLVVQVPPALGSPKLSGHLLTIPEGKRIPDNVQEIEAMLQNSSHLQQLQQQQQCQQPKQNGNLPETNASTQTSFESVAHARDDTAASNTQQDGFVHNISPDNSQPFQPTQSIGDEPLTNPFWPNGSGLNISSETTSSVSINQTPLSSNSLVSPDALVIFPMDSESLEKNNEDIKENDGTSA